MDGAMRLSEQPGISILILLLTGCLTAEGSGEPASAGVGVEVTCSWDRRMPPGSWETTPVRVCSPSSENAQIILMEACLTTGWECRITCDADLAVCVLPEEGIQIL